MRTIFDQFAKQLFEKGASEACIVKTEAEIHHGIQRADLRVTPDPERVSSLAKLGMLGRMCMIPCLIECFHKTPDVLRVTDCVYEILGFRRAKPGAAEEVPPRVSWVISSGRPDAAIGGFRFRGSKRWGPGVYNGPPLLRMKLVVASELPVVRDTLLVRMMGAGKVFDQAKAELKALPRGAPERRLAVPVLLTCFKKIPSDPAKRTREQEEFWMSMQDVVESWRQEILQEGLEKGRLDLLSRQFERRLGRKLAASERARLGERLDSLGADRLGDVVLDLSPEALAAWLGDPKAT